MQGEVEHVGDFSDEPVAGSETSRDGRMGRRRFTRGQFVTLRGTRCGLDDIGSRPLQIRNVGPTGRRSRIRLGLLRVACAHSRFSQIRYSLLILSYIRHSRVPVVQFLWLILDEGVWLCNVCPFPICSIDLLRNFILVVCLSVCWSVSLPASLPACLSVCPQIPFSLFRLLSSSGLAPQQQQHIPIYRRASFFFFFFLVWVQQQQQQGNVVVFRPFNIPSSAPHAEHSSNTPVLRQPSQTHTHNSKGEGPCCSSSSSSCSSWFVSIVIIIIIINLLWG